MTAVTSTAWRQLWANRGKPIFKSFRVRLKMKRLNALVFPILNFRLSRWPFSVTKAKRLDHLQRKMVGIVCGVRLLAGESFEVYWRRRNRFISELIGRNTWSSIWAKRVSTWHDHVQRNTLGFCWSTQLSDCNTHEFLEARRHDNCGRPHVRSVSGWASARWYESVPVAIKYLNS